MASMSKKIPGRMSISDLAKAENPYPVYQNLLEKGPIWRAGGNQWLLVGHDEVAESLRNPLLKQYQVSAVLKQFPSSAETQKLLYSPATEFTEVIMAGRDSDEHKQLRSWFAQQLNPFLKEIDSIINTELDSIFVDLEDIKQFDAIENIAFVFPIRVLGRIVGIPVSAQNDIASKLLVLNGVFSGEYHLQQEKVNCALLNLRDCISQYVFKHSAVEPQKDNLICRLLSSNENILSPKELVDNIIFLMFAGFETSLNLMANGLDVLLDNPSEQKKLREDIRILPSAIEEILRFSSPVHITGRYTTSTTFIADQRISAGRIIYLCLAAANRDEKQFSNPHQFDVTRANNNHLAFGHGPHKCIGALIARREAYWLFHRLLTKYKSIERVGCTKRKTSATIRSITHLPINLNLT